jgi:tellurite methyltransferase
MILRILLLSLVLPLGSLAGIEEEPEGPVESSRTKTTRLMALTGDGDFGDDRTAWDRTYARLDYVFGKDPADFLVDNVDKLPKGKALDIATGEGRNAVYLAKKGFLVEGVDISLVGLRKAKKLAAENGVKIQTTNADLNKYKIKPDSYSVILNFYYLQRSLFPQIKAGLKKGGVVVFETHTTEHLKNPGSNSWEKEFLLQPGELKKAFADFEILHYSESNDGKKAIASLVARKK